MARQILKYVFLVGRIAGTVLAIFALVILFMPDLLPVRSVNLSGKLDNISIETVNLKEFLDRTGLPDTSYSSEDLKFVGYLIRFDVTIEGFKGEKCFLKWSVYEAENKSRVPEPLLVDQDGPVITAEVIGSDKGSGEFFVPIPEGDSNFFVRLELYAPNGRRLTYADTDPFPGSS